MDISGIDDLRTLHELFTAGMEGRLASLGADAPGDGGERRETAVRLLESRLRQAEEARDAALRQVDEEKEAALRRYDEARAELERRFGAEVDRYRQLLAELGAGPPAAEQAKDKAGGERGKQRRSRRA
jgi:hypothetical protein